MVCPILENAESDKALHVLFGWGKQKYRVTISWDDLAVFSSGATEEAAYKIYYPLDIWDSTAYKTVTKIYTLILAQ